MSTITKLTARLWGEGAEQIHEWAQEGKEVFEGSDCDSYFKDSSCYLSWSLRGSIPNEVFERIAFEFPELKALGWYCQELLEYCGTFYIKNGEYVCIPSPSDDLSEEELLVFSGDVEAQLETDDLMWIKQAALQGSAEAQIRLAEEYQNCSDGSDMYWELAKKWYLKAAVDWDNAEAAKEYMRILSDDGEYLSILQFAENDILIDGKHPNLFIEVINTLVREKGYKEAMNLVVKSRIDPSFVFLYMAYAEGYYDDELVESILNEESCFLHFRKRLWKSFDIDLSLKGDKGRNALYLAVNYSALSTTKWLIEECKADVRVTDSDGNGLLFSAVLDSANPEFMVPIVKYLLDNYKTEDISQNEFGYSSAFMLARVEQIPDSMLKRQIESMDDVNEISSSGESLFSRIAVFRPTSTGLLKLMIEKGADINLVNNTGETVFHYLAGVVFDYDELESILPFILKNGGDINRPDYFGDDPIHKAIDCGNRAFLDLASKLNEDKKNRSELFISAAEYGEINILDYFVNEEHLDINCTDSYGRTALHHVALACSGAENSEYRDEFLEKAVWLVENGVDVNTFDKAGCTALHYAAKNYFRKLVQFFLRECNMNPSIKDPRKKNGKTPVELIPDGHYGIVKLFEKAEKNNR